MKKNTRMRGATPRSFSRRVAARFLQDESGVASVGAVIWVPFFIAVITLAVDASLMMMNRGDMWRVAGEASRQLALGSITTAEIAAFVEAHAVRGASYAASVETTADAVTTRISVPIKDVSITAWFADSTGNISVAVSHRLDV